MAWSTTPGSRIDKVDSRLTDAMERAAVSFARDNPGYSVEGFSGKKGRTAGTPNHPAGKAVDVNIVDPSGKRLGNVRNATTFRTYEKYAQTVRQELDKAGLTGVGRWGGYFRQGVPFDQMHIDLGPRNSMAYGSWEEGMNDAGFGALPGAQSIGMGTVRGLPVDRAPTPFRPDQPNPNNLRPSMLDGIPANGVNGISRSPLGPVSMPSSPLSPNGFSGGLMSPTSLGSLSPSAVSSMAARTAPRGPVSAPVARAPDIASMPSTASLSPVSMTSTPMSPANVSSPLAPSATSFGPAAPGPMPGPAPASLASAYGQLGSTLAQAGVTLGGMPAPNSVVATPSALPAPNAPVAMPPAPVQQPVPQPLPPPAVPRAMPTQSFPDVPTAPRSFSPADIYGGQVGTATASDGNTVGRDPFGRTTVTNQYGVTTAMTPDGKQAAYGGMPGPGGASSLFGGAKMSPKAQGVIGGLLGAALGTAIAGPAGGLIGGMLGKSALGGGLTRGGFPAAPAMSNVDYANTNRANFSGFGSGRDASAAEANRGGRGVTSGGTGLW